MAAKPIRIIVITSPDQLDQEWIGQVAHEPDIEHVDRVGSLSAGINLAKQNRPDIVILDREPDQTEQAIREIFTSVPGTLCIALATAPDVATLRRLVGAGARDVIGRPVNHAELMHTLRFLIEAELDRRVQTVPTAAAPARTRGKLVVVAAPKGGVGSTMIATNLAVALRRVGGGRVALADFDLQFGDIAVHLNLVPRHTLQDLLPRHDEIDDAMLGRVLQSHDSGISVLLAPDSPAFAGNVELEQIDAVLDALTERFSFVICDTWTLIDEIAERLMERADELLIVATPEVPALRNARTFLEHLRDQNLASGRLTFVLNRFPSINGVSLQDVEKHLRHPVGATLPSEGKFVTDSANRGVPVVTAYPKSWVAQSLLKLAAYVSGDNVVPITLDNETGAGSDVDTRGTADSRERRGLMRMIRGQA
jgi:pilus assembly protein CpaE